MNHCLDLIQILCGGSLGIYNELLSSLGIPDDLINFWDKFMKNKMADGRQNGRP